MTDTNTVTTNADAINPKAFAVQMGDMLAKSDAFTQMVEEREKAHSTIQRGPFYTMHIIESVIGVENMVRLPWPGTDKDSPLVKDAKLHNIQRLADEFEDQVPNGKGGTKKAKVKVLNVIAARTPKGQALVTQMAQIKMAQNGNPAAPAELRNLKPYELDHKETMTQQALRRLNTLVNDAVKLHHIIEAIRTLPGVSIDYDTTTDENGNKVFANTDAPIIISDISDMPKSAVNTKAYTAREVLAMDIQLARLNKEGNQWKSLDYSRTAPSDDTGDGENEGKALTLNDVESQLAGILHYFENSGNTSNIYARVRKDQAFRMTLASFRDELNAIYSKHDISELVAADRKAEETKKAAEKQAAA